MRENVFDSHGGDRRAGENMVGRSGREQSARSGQTSIARAGRLASDAGDAKVQGAGAGVCPGYCTIFSGRLSANCISTASSSAEYSAAVWSPGRSE